jgi:neutral amino acid transport system substrate-binding protein
VQEWGASAGAAHWYLSPSLKSDEFVQNAGPGALDGSAGVSPAVSTDAPLFIKTFGDRWAGDSPLTEAYFYYDALALVALALEAAAQHGETPDGDGIRAHIRQVSNASDAQDVQWFDLGRGLDTLKRGLPVKYRGASGSTDLDANGEVGTGLVRIWTVTEEQIVDGKLELVKPL